ncbi:MAG: WG repeat-containing protein [Saprospirales bacterium]|nr:WG repeat-containing protein [Saprospirales bacterium]
MVKKSTNSTYDDLGEYYDGLAGFKDNKKAGYIDTSGNIAIAATYDEVSNFTNGTAMVKQENAYFQIDKKGKPINNTKYTSVANPLNGSFPVKKGTNFGLIDSKGNIIADFKYYEIGTISDDMIWARKEKDGNLILLNKNGKKLPLMILKVAEILKIVMQPY